MLRLRSIVLGLTLSIVLVANLRAESPYDRWAYSYTVYGYRDIELALRDRNVSWSSNAQTALVASWYAWEDAWDARINDNRTSWNRAWMYNEWAAYFAERAARETGVGSMWQAYNRVRDAADWCHYAYLYFE